MEQLCILAKKVRVILDIRDNTRFVKLLLCFKPKVYIDSIRGDVNLVRKVLER